jgi:hypothetical protein
MTVNVWYAVCCTRCLDVTAVDAPGGSAPAVNSNTWIKVLLKKCLPANQKRRSWPSTAQPPHSVARLSRAPRALQCCAGVSTTRTWQQQQQQQQEEGQPQHGHQQHQPFNLCCFRNDKFCLYKAQSQAASSRIFTRRQFHAGYHAPCPMLPTLLPGCCTSCHQSSSVTLVMPRPVNHALRPRGTYHARSGPKRLPAAAAAAAEKHHFTP